MRRLDLTHYAQRASYQPSLWGDTYLTPQEASVYLNEMLTMLAVARSKAEEKKRAK
jgi:hypothetical protein